MNSKAANFSVFFLKYILPFFTFQYNFLNFSIVLRRFENFHNTMNVIIFNLNKRKKEYCSNFDEKLPILM